MSKKDMIERIIGKSNNSVIIYQLAGREVEGVCPFKDRENWLFVVVDADEPTSPCELCEIQLLGNW